MFYSKTLTVIMSYALFNCMAIAAPTETKLNSNFQYELSKQPNDKYLVKLIEKDDEGKTIKTYTSSREYNLKSVADQVDRLNLSLLTTTAEPGVKLDEEKKSFDLGSAHWYQESALPNGSTNEQEFARYAFDTSISLHKYIKKLEEKIRVLETKECPPCLNIGGVGVAPSACKQ